MALGLSCNTLARHNCQSIDIIDNSCDMKKASICDLERETEVMERNGQWSEWRRGEASQEEITDIIIQYRHPVPELYW